MVALAFALVPACAVAAESNLRVRLASGDVGADVARTFSGSPVIGVNGDEVGTLEDFVVDLRTGKVVFAVVSSGGFLGLWEKLRIVPFAAIQRAPGGEGFTTPVEQANWDRLPLVQKGEFNAAGRLVLNPEQRRQLGEAWFGHFTRDASPQGSTGAAGRQGTAVAEERLARAANLRGVAVRGDRQEIGVTEDVVIDFERGVALALLRANPIFAGSAQDFLVPLTQLEPTDDGHAFTSRLSRADFQRAQAGVPSPTGRTISPRPSRP